MTTISRERGINRLLMMAAATTEAGAAMATERQRIDHYRARHIEGTAPRAVTGFNLFQTPPPIAARMADLVRERLPEGGRILEPSAGLGRLYTPLEGLRAAWVMIEEAAECVAALRGRGLAADIQQRDFLTTTPAGLGQFDAVIMNPPFKMGRDITHVKHALTMVKPGGRLVSLCYNGTRQNEKLKPMADHWEVLPEGSFRTEGTSASVALIVIDKR